MLHNYDINDKIDFGKYKGLLIKDIIDKHISYIDWAYMHIKNFHLLYNAFKYYNDKLNENLFNKMKIY
jgi:hypothetical protein